MIKAITAQAKLKLWKTYTSYTQNGKYYTLPEIPQFDIHGIWQFKKVAFSKHGNLKKTIIKLVASSSAGLTGKQLCELLGLSPQSFLHHFCDCPGIWRKKHAGFRALKLFKGVVERLIAGVSINILLPETPTIHFYPEIQKCQACDTKFHVHKTSEKTVVTMDIGTF